MTTRAEDFVRCQGKDLYVQRLIPSGHPSSGLTLVFLHDALGCTTSWGSFPSLLCADSGLDAVIFDRAGHGRSSSRDEGRNTDYLEREALEVLPQLLARLEIHQPILIGASDGASIALIYGAHHHHVRGVIAIAGHGWVLEKTLAGIGSTYKNLQSPAAMHKLIALHGEKASRLVEDWASTWLSEDFRSWDITPLLSKIQCPVLVLQGADDEYADSQHALDLARSIGANAASVILPGCGHFPHKEQPERTLAAIHHFLSPILSSKTQHHVK